MCRMMKQRWQSLIFFVRGVRKSALGNLVSREISAHALIPSSDLSTEAQTASCQRRQRVEGVRSKPRGGESTTGPRSPAVTYGCIISVCPGRHRFFWRGAQKLLQPLKEEKEEAFLSAPLTVLRELLVVENTSMDLDRIRKEKPHFIRPSRSFAQNSGNVGAEFALRLLTLSRRMSLQ